MSKVTEWQEVLAKLTPEQRALYDAAELEWQAELDAYIKDYEQAMDDYDRRHALGVKPRVDEILWFWIGSHADYDKLLP
jgi:hypothetical protein